MITNQPTNLKLHHSFVASKLPPPLVFVLFLSLQFSPQTLASATARSLSRSRFLARPVFAGLPL
ncbi:hypothetical protein Hanom_Chr06g00503181 [Helianthus anomalus]|nr:hypothetical protein HanPSC8_Chr06g0243711 [Helianthus annuus]